MTRARGLDLRHRQQAGLPPDPFQCGIVRILGARFDAPHDTFVFIH